MLDRIGSDRNRDRDRDRGGILRIKRKSLACGPNNSRSPKNERKKGNERFGLEECRTKGKKKKGKSRGGEGRRDGGCIYMYIPGVTSTGAAYQMLGSVLFFGGGGGQDCYIACFLCQALPRPWKYSSVSPPHTPTNPSSSQPPGGYEITLFLI